MVKRKCREKITAVVFAAFCCVSFTVNGASLAQKTRAASGTGSSSTVTGSKILYTNKQYGFTFTLPASWKGFKVLSGQWNGLSNTAAENTIAKGPMRTLRNPTWTKVSPYQDIPIMIFTLSQWNAMQNDKFHVSAAPVPPYEIGRNNLYVFALPPRYNFAFPRGYKDVEEIIESKPLKPITIK